MKQTQFIFNNTNLFSVDFIYEPHYIGSLPALIRHEKHGLFQIKSVVDEITDNKDVLIRKYVIEKA
jgi:hypothetical protein